MVQPVLCRQCLRHGAFTKGTRQERDLLHGDKGLPAGLIKLKEFKTEDGATAFTLNCGDVLRVGEYACMEAKCDGPPGAAAAHETMFAFAWFDSGICNFMTTVDVPADAKVLRRTCLAGKSAEEALRVRPERASFSAASNAQPLHGRCGHQRQHEVPVLLTEAQSEVVARCVLPDG
jgi:hypothetical protein